jgi:hypothetical protein
MLMAIDMISSALGKARLTLRPGRTGAVIYNTSTAAMKKYLLAFALGAATISNASANGFDNWLTHTEGYQVCLRLAETQGVGDWDTIREAVRLCPDRYRAATKAISDRPGSGA